jgi:histidinol-phosphate aminotransferase
MTEPRSVPPGRAVGPFPRPDYAALSRYVPDRIPVEIDLSDNTNLWGAHPAALQVVREAAGDDVARYPSPYADELRAAAAARFGVAPDQVATGTGSDGVLDALWRAVAEHGGTIVWPGPTFSMIPPLCTMNGRTGVEVPWAEALADPATLLAADPVLIYVCRPNNPSGVQPSRDWCEALLEAVGTDGPVVVFDEAYAEYAGETLIERVLTHPRALVTRTLSKAYGLAGLRVGLGLGSADLIGEIEKSRGPYMVGRLVERVAVAALRDDSGWLDDCVAETVANRERLAAELQSRGHAPLPSQANFLFIPMPEGTAKARSDALRTHGVSVRPFVGVAAADPGDGLRVSIGPWPMMQRFLSAWDQT